MTKLDTRTFQEVQKALVMIRQLMRDHRYMEAEMEMEGVNKWLEAFGQEVVKDEKYLATMKPISNEGSIICHCGAIKEKKYAQCYDCARGEKEE